MIEIIELSSEQEIIESLEDAGLPKHMYQAVVHWIKRGRIPGQFLQAVLKNDLMDAINRADEVNLMCLYAWAKWFQNAAPSSCYGSLEKFEYWANKQRDPVPHTKPLP